MHVEVTREVPADAGAVVLGATAGGVPEGCDPAVLAAMGFEGKVDQVAVLGPDDGAAPDSGDRTGGRAVRVVVGVGDLPDDRAAHADEVASALRRAAAVGVRAARRHEVVAMGLVDLADASERPGAAAAVAEGALLGAYRFGRYKSASNGPSVDRVAVLAGGGKRVVDAVARGVRIAEGQCLARDLVNEPGGALTPAAFAEVAVEVAERENLQVSVMDQDDITEAGLGGLLGVNRGSVQPPRFVQLTYEPVNPRGTLAIVGKGITFDSGGLSMKTPEGMIGMKDDMAGAAAVLGAFSAFAAAGVRARVHGYLPLTDNMTGGDATRPGDVLRIRNGTTVEVLNTDAEGRLVLADALSLASEDRPDAIVDLATLTGAADVALGPLCAGLLANHDSWSAQIEAAAAAAGERVWRLPLIDDYRRWLESEVADMRNISRNRSAGTIVASLFLSRFVGEGIPWAHLDIATTAWSNETRGTDLPGGTGYGVRLLVELARNFRRPR